MILSSRQAEFSTYKELKEQSKRNLNILAATEKDEEELDAETRDAHKHIRDRVMDIITEMLELNII